MENGEKFLTYLNRVKQFAATLKSMYVIIDDKELAMASLNGLPSSYESLIVALDALRTEGNSFTFDLVKSRLLQEEQRAQERDAAHSTSTNSSALFGASGNDHRKFGKGGRSRFSSVRCTNCNRFGHYASHCWGKDINGQRPPNPNRTLDNNDIKFYW